MKIAILSRNPQLYSTKRLVNAARRRGHSVSIIDPLRCYMNITPTAPEIHYRGKPLTGIEAVIPRIGTSVTYYGLAVLRQLEAMGVKALNSSDAVARSRDKLLALQLLANKGIGMPITGFAHSPDDTEGLIGLVGGAPLVVKLTEGTQGVGVVLCETQSAATSVIEAFRGLDAYFLVQQFVKEAGGSDIRCFVVGGQVVAAMQRQAAPGEFRSNLHRGGHATNIQITRLERSTAIRAARLLGLNVAGVDLLRTAKGPMVLEVNSSPGLEGIERTTGENIAAAIIEFLEDDVARRKRKK